MILLYTPLLRNHAAVSSECAHLDLAYLLTTTEENICMPKTISLQPILDAPLALAGFAMTAAPLAVSSCFLTDSYWPSQLSNLVILPLAGAVISSLLVSLAALHLFGKWASKYPELQKSDTNKLLPLMAIVGLALTMGIGIALNLFSPFPFPLLSLLALPATYFAGTALYLNRAAAGTPPLLTSFHQEDLGAAAACTYTPTPPTLERRPTHAAAPAPIAQDSSSTPSIQLP